VRLYQDTTVPAVPVGVAEWRTGQMTRNATAKLSGGGSGGSFFAISGGNTQAIDAPEIDLNVEALAVGGYGSVARLHNAPRLQLDGDLDSVALTLNSNGIYAPGSAASATFGAPVADVRDGDQVTLRGSVTNGVSPFSAGAGTQFILGSFPAAIAPKADQFFLTSLSSGSYSYATVIIRGTTGGTPGRVEYIGGVTLTTGFLLSLNNVRWRIGA
jgi:hypothetical protein